MYKTEETQIETSFGSDNIIIIIIGYKTDVVTTKTHTKAKKQTFSPICVAIVGV
jgi:hypothetical protein